mmetsp:Transcript_86479/g.239809  ORF Transcript_86479/g.239809 Transcript_86479/m.239809 type:complete len:242 (+) Transcript_86479:373-1098(+)
MASSGRRACPPTGRPPPRWISIAVPGSPIGGGAGLRRRRAGAALSTGKGALVRPGAARAVNAVRSEAAAPTAATAAVWESRRRARVASTKRARTPDTPPGITPLPGTSPKVALPATNLFPLLMPAQRTRLASPDRIPEHPIGGTPLQILELLASSEWTTVTRARTASWMMASTGRTDGVGRRRPWTLSGAAASRAHSSGRRGSSGRQSRTSANSSKRRCRQAQAPPRPRQPRVRRALQWLR